MKESLRLAGEPIAPPPGLPVLAMGFRPFFLLAALFGAVVMPLWLVMFTGGLPPGGGLPPTWWHAHEMFVGYTGAVLAGFLLTAVRHWSGGHLTADNGALAALCALWVAGRAVHAPGIDLGVWSSAPDVAWLLGTTWAIGRPLVRAGSRRNYGFLVALPLLGLASVGMHLAAGGAAAAARPSLDVPVAVLAAIMAVVAGRIVPMFTRNALGVEPTRSLVAERALRPLLAGVVAVALLDLPAALEGGVLGLAGGALLFRMVGWKTLATLRAPILWILHLGHAWIGVGLLLQGGAALGWLPPSAGVHAITAGAIGSLTLGMMARVSLGHTGRRLKVHGAIAVAFGLMGLAGMLRVVASLTGTPMGLLHGAGTLWSSSLLVFLMIYSPILLRPRADGRPG